MSVSYHYRNPPRRVGLVQCGQQDDMNVHNYKADVGSSLFDSFLPLVHIVIEYWLNR